MTHVLDANGKIKLNTVTNHGDLTGLTVGDPHTQYALLAGRAGDTLVLADDATDAPLNITARAAEPSSPNAEDVYLDDGTNTVSGDPGFRRYTGAAWEDTGGGGGIGAAFNHRMGLLLTKVDSATIAVSTGSVMVESTLVEKKTSTVLALGTAGNWIGGSGLEAASSWVNVYVDAAGNILLHDTLPNYPTAEAASRVATARVNQAGWDGTAGQGLNATSIVYDGDTGEGGIAAGMYLGVFSVAYTTGRGKGSAAAGSKNALSFALITAVNAGTNTITVAAGHQIAIFDNDYLIAVEAGAPLFTSIGGTWYRWLGALWNDGSSNLTDNRADDNAYVCNEGADYSTSSTSFATVDATNLAIPVITTGRNIQVGFTGNVSFATVPSWAFFELLLDGVVVAGDDGISATFCVTSTYPELASINRILQGVLAGSHTITLQWKVTANTAVLYAGVTALRDFHPQLFVREV